MPVIIRKVDAGLSNSRHHGGGIMSRGGFEVEEVEVSVPEYARRLVLKASSDVAYREWKKIEYLSLDDKFYIFSDSNKHLELIRVGLKKTLEITGNDFWRQEARKFIEDNYEDDPLSDVSDSKMCRKYGEQL